MSGSASRSSTRGRASPSRGPFIATAQPASRAVSAERSPPEDRIWTREETGLLVPPDDPDAFAAALARLVGDPYLRLDLGEGALAGTRRRSWDRSFAELRDAYRIPVHGTQSDAPARIAA